MKTTSHTGWWQHQLLSYSALDFYYSGQARVSAGYTNSPTPEFDLGGIETSTKFNNRCWKRQLVTGSYWCKNISGMSWAILLGKGRGVGVRKHIETNWGSNAVWARYHPCTNPKKNVRKTVKKRLEMVVLLPICNS